MRAALSLGAKNVISPATTAQSTGRKLSDLSPACRRLVEAIRRFRFGQIRRLRVRNGEPVWDPCPEIVSDIKFGGDRPALPMHESNGRTLKPAFLQLFDEFERRKDFTIECLQFNDGVPTRRQVKETTM
jgi:hypothetical protein